MGVLFPLSLTLSNSLNRREICINQLATFSSNLKASFMAHVDWDWYTANKDSTSGETSSSGRHMKKKRIQAHLHKTRVEYRRLIEIFRLILNAPRGKSIFHNF